MASQSEVLSQLTDAGVSIWLDDLDRSRLATGTLQELIDGSSVRGVTTNPSIFEKAIGSGAASYQEDVDRLTAEGLDVDGVLRVLTTDDVRKACDLFRGVWEATEGVDGRVSIEVDPRLAHDADATITAAHDLWSLVDRPNLLVKIPATDAGLEAITAAIAEGISVNVTLIFSVERYRTVIDAYLAGLEKAAAAGRDLSTIASVASFFVSRVDVSVDARLDDLDSTDAAALRGKAAIANARLAWFAYLDTLASPRWAELARQGAHPQRPLWASTGVKDPAYDDTRYVMELVAPGCVNTMPEPTLDAVRDHGVFHGDTVTGTDEISRHQLAALAPLGIDMHEVFAELESEGVTKFIDAWEQLRSTVSAAMSHT
jgi:transaldolase